MRFYQVILNFLLAEDGLPAAHVSPRGTNHLLIVLVDCGLPRPPQPHHPQSVISWIKKGSALHYGLQTNEKLTN